MIKNKEWDLKKPFIKSYKPYVIFWMAANQKLYKFANFKSNTDIKKKIQLSSTVNMLCIHF